MLGELERDPARTVSPYFNKNKSGALLRSLHHPDNRGAWQDHRAAMHEFPYGKPSLHSSAELVPLRENISASQPPAETFSDNIDDLILSALTETREAVYSDSAISPANKNKEIVLQLYQRGIFNLKDAVIKVAEQLNISKNTVYAYP